MSISIDSNAPYATSFAARTVQEAVYMVSEDPLLGLVLAIVYRASPASSKISVILIGKHGVSGYVDMTLDAASRYFGACRGLAAAHFASPVRKALAIAALRTYSTMDKPLRRYLLNLASADVQSEQDLLNYYDEAAAGALGSRFRLVHGKFPQDIGLRVLEAGLLEAKRIRTSVVDVIYEDSDYTIDQNNDLVYMLGTQLEQLFDPLSEYSPEPTEKSYIPPTESLATLEDDDAVVQGICEELYMLQSHVRADLISFLQDFLIPLRVRVLSNEIAGVTIGKLNTIFPPTIDEIFRVNNLFYEALQNALPYGSFEVLRACGTTIPYFYRASMRHEAATRSFSRNLDAYEPELRREIEAYSPHKIEVVMHASLHLTKAKLIIDRLVTTRVWSPEEKPLVNEYYRVATGTIDSFGKETTVAGSYNKRTFTPTGKLLVEIAEGWPTELEYGWMNRRVVTIFDAVDILEPESARRQLHHILIMFTDALLILEPTEPIPMSSISGLHIPSIGDILMHAMLNEAPLDHNIPRLKVVAWAPILDVTFASFGTKSILVNSQPSPFNLGKTNTADGTIFSKLYSLVRSDHESEKFVELLAKAKVTTKTQPFHLFKIFKDDETSLYSTVHELQGYNDEVNRYPVAVFLNSTVNDTILKQHKLAGAISVKFTDDGEMIDVGTYTRMNYENHKVVTRDQFKGYVIDEITYLFTLSLSSQNRDVLDNIVSSNLSTVDNIVSWAQLPPPQVRIGHRRGAGHHPNLSRTIDATLTEGQPLSQPQPRQMLAPKGSAAALRQNQNQNQNHTDPDVSVPRLRKMDNISPGYATRSGSGPLDRKPSMAADQSAMSQSNSFSYSEAESQIIYHFPSRSKSRTLMQSHSQGQGQGLGHDGDGNGDGGEDEWESMGGSVLSSAEEAEQRDVDEWYCKLENRGASSLSSEISELDTSASDFSPVAHSRQESAVYEPIQIGGFLKPSDSTLYNQHAGRAYPALGTHTRDSSTASVTGSASGSAASRASRVSHVSHESIASRSSRSTIMSIGQLSHSSGRSIGLSEGSDDFTWLADMVSEGEQPSRSSSALLYPGLRESSLVRLGNYVLSNDKSVPRFQPPTSSWSLHGNPSQQYLGSQEPTPKLEDLALNESDSDIENLVKNPGFDVAAESEPRAPPSARRAAPPSLPKSTSMASFQRLVMSSSLNTLQLASITVQLDQIIASAPPIEQQLLRRIKVTLSELYNQTHRFAKQYSAGSSSKVGQLADREREARRHTSWMVWTLVSMNRLNLVPPLLEIEFHRRTMLAESLGVDTPLNLWRV